MEDSSPRQRRRLDIPHRALTATITTAPFRRPRAPVPPPAPLDERLLERFRISAYGLPLPPALPGYIRLLTHRFDAPPVPLTLFYANLVAYDRTFTEWYAWIATLQDETQSEEAVRILHTNLRLRTQFRRLVQRRRAVIAAAPCNCVGETDLYTLEPIPARHQVRVVDLLQKRTYVFQYTTLEKTMAAALSYATYGIAEPMAPKNPYTNMPWTLGQCMSILQQLVQIRTACHRFLPEDLVEFAKAGYRPVVYLQNRRQLLHVRAAETYFADPAHPDTFYDYSDTLDELYDVYMPVQLDGHSLLRKLVMKRMLSPEHMQGWDGVVLAFWIWRNHAFLYRGRGTWTTFGELLEAAEKLHRDSLLSWRMRPRRILQRRSAAPPAPAAPTEAPAAPTEATSYSV